jgi:hypothetical protein
MLFSLTQAHLTYPKVNKIGKIVDNQTVSNNKGDMCQILLMVMLGCDFDWTLDFDLECTELGPLRLSADPMRTGSLLAA